ncbi:MAG TPA: response regulator, partial [Casimicrobiaceae bacterium]|nr:response regulator [Casimicrobiaceae bacterium]
MIRKSRGQPKVLVIDDEPDLLELLELTLSRMGLDTTRAESVGEAIRLLDREPYDLCLTDMRLPDGEGLRVVEHINQKGLDVPVAVITAYGSAENAVAALKAGAFDYLAKPVALEQLR